MTTGKEFSTALDLEGRDLIALAAEDELDPVDERDQEIATLLEALDRGQSVLLVGPPGVGKSAVLRGAALAMARRGRGRIVELSTIGVFAGTKYLGEWQSKLTAIVRSAMASSAVLAISDVANLASAGRTAQNDHTMLDALRPFIEQRKLVVLGEVTPETLRLIERAPRFADLFRKINVAPLDVSLIDPLIERAARRAGLMLDADGRRHIAELTSRFHPTRPQPGPALALLDQVGHYQREKENIGESAAVTPAFVERVYSIYSGLPPFIVSREATMPVSELRAWFRERLVGQEGAIEAVVEAIALFKAGLHDPSRPLGTFLFVGPTGVGKTELARALATFLFGSPMRMLRFDLSELKDPASLHVLMGDPRDPDKPALLVDTVRAQPFQVVLFDELEKAHPNVWDLLLPVLDEGRLTPPFGEPVDFRNTLVICTSNVGARESQLRTVGFGEEDDDGDERVRRSLESQFRPELLNRFQHTAIFRPLTRGQVRQVAHKELSRILQRDGIVGRNLAVDVDEEALDLVIEKGFDARYGARALKRELQTRLVLPIAVALMEKPIVPGQIVKVITRSGGIHVQMIDTVESAHVRREQAPVRAAGRKWTRDDLARTRRELAERVEELASSVGEVALREEQARLLALRADPAFWRSGDDAARTLRDLDYLSQALDRIAQLRSDLESAEPPAGSNVRTLIVPLVQEVTRLENAVALAELELLQMGRNARWDALVEIRPLGAGGKNARDLLVRTYGDWARSRQFQVELLCEPIEPDEPAMLGVTGSYASGLLRRESGLHRVALSKLSSVARVRVAPWTDRKAPIGFLEQHALKRAGAYGGKIRSRLECAGGLVLPNGRTLAENREIAIRLAGSWREAPPPTDEIVRRYEPETPLIRDVLTDTTSGHPDALSPERLHQLLCDRVRFAWKLRNEPPPAA